MCVCRILVTSVKNECLCRFFIMWANVWVECTSWSSVCLSACDHWWSRVYLPSEWHECLCRFNIIMWRVYVITSLYDKCVWVSLVKNLWFESTWRVYVCDESIDNYMWKMFVSNIGGRNGGDGGRAPSPAFHTFLRHKEIRYLISL